MQRTRKELLGFYPKTTVFTPAKQVSSANGDQLIFALPNVLRDSVDYDMLFHFALFRLGDKTLLRRASLIIGGKRFASVDSATMQKDVYDRVPLPFLSLPLHGYLMKEGSVHVVLEFVKRADSSTQLVVEYRRADPNMKRALLAQQRVGPFRFTAPDGRMGDLFYEGGQLYWTSRWGHREANPEQEGGFEELAYNAFV